MKGNNLAGHPGERGRVENDYYATPSEATIDILNREDLGNSILEPACGQGHISKTILSCPAYNNIKIISTDLIDRGYGQGGIDFLTYNYNETFDTIITNPPFKYAKEFAEKALAIVNKKVIMFIKIQFLEGQSRKLFLQNSPLKTIYVFSRRINPLRNGNELDENGKKWCSTMCFAWFVWENGYKGNPEVKWI